jgi:hypothetical protein
MQQDREDQCLAQDDENILPVEQQRPAQAKIVVHTAAKRTPPSMRPKHGCHG